MLTSDEERVADEAKAFARKNKRRIAKELTEPAVHPVEKDPVAVFMAGSPGAGKTEASRELIAKFEVQGHKVLCIDPDELRCYFDAYDGTNSYL